jgi:integrase
MKVLLPSSAQSGKAKHEGGHFRPKCDWITSHTARRSFCTNEFLAGTPVKLIMNISGHKKENTFYKYIRITPEEAAQKIKELWQERGDTEGIELESVVET